MTMLRCDRYFDGHRCCRAVHFILLYKTIRQNYIFSVLLKIGFMLTIDLSIGSTELAAGHNSHHSDMPLMLAT